MPDRDPSVAERYPVLDDAPRRRLRTALCVLTFTHHWTRWYVEDDGALIWTEINRRCRWCNAIIRIYARKDRENFDGR